MHILPHILPHIPGATDEQSPQDLAHKLIIQVCLQLYTCRYVYLFHTYLVRACAHMFDKSLALCTFVSTCNECACVDRSVVIFIDLCEFVAYVFDACVCSDMSLALHMYVSTHSECTRVSRSVFTHLYLCVFAVYVFDWCVC